MLTNFSTPTRTLEAGDFQRLREFFTARHESIIKIIRRLVEIETPTGDVEGNKKIVNLLCDAAREIDANMAIERFGGDKVGEHLYLKFKSGDSINDDKKYTLVIGHTDTVHPLGSLVERPVRIEDEKLYAPGVFDMKANCALGLEAVRALREVDIKLPCDIVLLLTCDEETGSATSRELIERTAAHAANVLVIEPSGINGEAKTARKGTGMWTIKARGIAAHAGLNPHAGASAILEIAKQIVRLHAFNDESETAHLNVGVINGGTRSNVVAAEAQIEIDARFSSMNEAQAIKTFIESLQPYDSRVQLEINGDINRLPLERNESVIALYEFARGLARRLDFELGEVSVGGASDGNFVSALGVPVLDGLGLRGDGAHAAHEHIQLDDIVPRGAFLAALLATL